MQKENVVICPPCGENVGLPTKRGAHKISPILPHLTAVLPPQGREMTVHGFTLIELLVVVLIISILAAVAVPQYKKAVVLSKVFTMRPLLNSIATAQVVYKLEHGDYTPDIAQLDITMPKDCQKIAFNYSGKGGTMMSCGTDFLLDMNLNNGGDGLAFNYCPNKNTSWNTCEATREFWFRRTDCGPQNNSSLGKYICKHFQ